MQEKFYSIKPQDLRVGQRFRIQNEASSYEEYTLAEPVKVKGYIIEMQSTEVQTGLPKLVLYNTNFPRDIFVTKLETEYTSRY